MAGVASSPSVNPPVIRCRSPDRADAASATASLGPLTDRQDAGQVRGGSAGAGPGMIDVPSRKMAAMASMTLEVSDAEVVHLSGHC